jgi:hypothetical protein
MFSLSPFEEQHQSKKAQNPKCNWMAQGIISSDRAYQKARQSMIPYYQEKAFGSLELFEQRVFEEQIVESAMRLLE